MSDKQNPSLTKGNSLPVEDEQHPEQNESSPKSYYYDDATGYEIYKEEVDEDDEEESGDGQDRREAATRTGR
jgi:hypothetical protein